MKVYHYTKANKLNSIFVDGFIATENLRSTNCIRKLTNYVWLTEKLSYPKTALPLFSRFPETCISTHLRYKNIYVDLDKLGNILGNFYRFGFDSNDYRLKKWYRSDERKQVLKNREWVSMENTANKVGDEVRCFWISTENLMLENFSLEVFRNGGWEFIFQCTGLDNLTKPELEAIDEHLLLSRNKCKEFGLPETYSVTY